MVKVIPSISAEIARIAPGFRALSIVVETAPVTDMSVGERALQEACRAVLTGEPQWEAAHIAAWGAVFEKFGAKPKRTPVSADALRKRVLRDGVMTSIDPVVDLYNAVSLRYAVPVGGENLTAYQGQPRLIGATGTEPFDTQKNGQYETEYPQPGEVVWCDDIGVTCRRWNWRQGVRTRLSVADKQMWFILESLPEMPLEALYSAGEMLTFGLTKMMPGLRFETTLVGAS